MGIKITDLPAASALTGTEVVPVTQGGTTKKTTAAALAALGGGGSVAFASITGAPTDNTALATALNAKAPKASPIFTGTLTTPQMVIIDGTSAQLQSSVDTTYVALNALSANGAVARRFDLGGSSVRALINGTVVANVDATGLQVTGNISATNFSGSSSGTNTGDQDLSGYATTSALAAKAPLANPIFTGNIEINDGEASVFIEPGTLDLNGYDGSYTQFNVNSLGAFSGSYVNIKRDNSVKGWFGYGYDDKLKLHAATTAYINGLTSVVLSINDVAKLSVTSSGVAISGTVTAANIVAGMSAFCSGKPANGEKVGGGVAPYAFTASQTNSAAKASTAATASTVFTVKNGATTVGTFTFAAAATTATVSVTSGAIAAGDLITIEGPATADATLADISFLLRA